MLRRKEKTAEEIVAAMKSGQTAIGYDERQLVKEVWEAGCVGYVEFDGLHYEKFYFADNERTAHLGSGFVGVCWCPVEGIIAIGL